MGCNCRSWILSTSGSCCLHPALFLSWSSPCCFLEQVPIEKRGGNGMTIQSKPLYGIDPYLEWTKKEGLAVTEDYGIDLFKVETATWPRYDVKAAAVHLKGRGDFANMFLFDVAPGRSTAPQRHLYEEVIYVLEGSGSSQLEFSDGRKKGFEWGPKSLFAIPLNAKHRHFNGSGRERALIVSTTDLPL